MCNERFLSSLEANARDQLIGKYRISRFCILSARDLPNIVLPADQPFLSGLTSLE